MTTLHTHTHPAPAHPPNPTPQPNTPACSTPTTASSEVSITAVTRSTLASASAFINLSRRTLFPSLGHDVLLDDAAVLEEGCVLVARDERGEIVAAVCYVPFDHRFTHLPWPVGTSVSGSHSTSTSNSNSTPSTPIPSATSSSSSLATSPPPPTLKQSSSCPCKTVEVLRLFVLPQYRRHGLAASLFRSLREHALAAGVQCMYLHTHPFLPGAIRFWEKQGFEVVCVDEDDEVWRTHHMQLMLGPT